MLMSIVLLPLVPSVFWIPVLQEGVRLANGAFLSSLITTFHFEPNVLLFHLHRESFAVIALLRPFLLSYSSLWSLLASEDLASSS